MQRPEAVFDPRVDRGGRGTDDRWAGLCKRGDIRTGNGDCRIWSGEQSGAAGPEREQGACAYRIGTREPDREWAVGIGTAQGRERFEGSR